MSKEEIILDESVESLPLAGFSTESINAYTNTEVVDKSSPPLPPPPSPSSEIQDVEKYLADVLQGLQKKQELKNNEVIQLILNQQQEFQNKENLIQEQLHQQPIINNKPVIYSSAAWTFTQGLILGQLSVIILIIVFIKFFVFTEAAPTQASSIPSKSNISIIKTSKKTSDDLDSISKVNTLNDNNNHEKEINQALGTGSIRLDSDKTLNSILEKTYYDVKIHKPESLDWFNVLVAQIISQGRLEALNDGNIYESLNKALNSPQVLQYFDKIKISEINIGDDYPIFSNCRVKNNEGRLEAKIDVDVSDTITLGVETNLLINQPKFMSASLPIKLSISVVRFSACLSVSLITVDNDKNLTKKSDKTNSNDDMNNESTNHSNNNNSNNNNEGDDILEGGNTNENFPNKEKNSNNINDDKTSNNDDNNGGHSIALMFSFSPDFRLEFETKSLIGSRAKLENIPRISSILENIIRKWFIERCIEPRFQLIKLPSMWPRKKNTRESVPTE